MNNRLQKLKANKFLIFSSRPYPSQKKKKKKKKKKKLEGNRRSLYGHILSCDLMDNSSTIRLTGTAFTPRDLLQPRTRFESRDG